MKKQRLDRVNSLLREVIQEVIQKEVRDPHVTTFVSVTKVEAAPDLHHAKVYISLIASDAEKQAVLKALQQGAGFIAVHASKKVELRYFPELLFKLDTSLDEHMNIERILGKIHEEQQSRPHGDTDHVSSDS